MTAPAPDAANTEETPMSTSSPDPAPMPDNLFGMAGTEAEYDAKVKREDRARDKGLEPCTTCGRGVREGSGWLVHVIGGGAEVIHPDAP